MTTPREFPRLPLIEAIAILDMQDAARIRTEYDGRGMFRPVSFGVVVPSMRDALRLMTALGVACGARIDVDDEDEAMLPDSVNELLASVQYDNMGHGVIVYFEGWRLSDS